jgi:hypothetical protein
MARKTSARVTRSSALQPAITSAVATVDSHPAFSGMSAKPGELYIPERYGRVSLRRYADACVMRIDGDCMAPLARHGDYIVISPSAPVVVGELVAFRVSAARWGVKQLDALPPRLKDHPESNVVGAYVFRQMNPPRIYVAPTDEFEAVCRVLCVVPQGKARVLDPVTGKPSKPPRMPQPGEAIAEQIAAAGGHAAPREPTIARPASARRHQRTAGRARS